MAKTQFEEAYVYFIKSEEYVKIGATTAHPAYRLKELQCGNPIRLRLLFYIKCKYTHSAWSMEKRLHNQFKEFHVLNEWFLREPIEDWALEAHKAFGEDFVFENEFLKRMAGLMPDIDDSEFIEDEFEDERE